MSLTVIQGDRTLESRFHANSPSPPPLVIFKDLDAGSFFLTDNLLCLQLQNTVAFVLCAVQLSLCAIYPSKPTTQKEKTKVKAKKVDQNSYKRKIKEFLENLMNKIIKYFVCLMCWCIAGSKMRIRIPLVVEFTKGTSFFHIKYIDVKIQLNHG